MKTLKLSCCQIFNKDVNCIVTSINYRRDVVTSIKPNYGVSVPVDNNRRDANGGE